MDISACRHARSAITPRYIVNSCILIKGDNTRERALNIAPPSDTNKWGFASVTLRTITYSNEQSVPSTFNMTAECAEVIRQHPHSLSVYDTDILSSHAFITSYITQSCGFSLYYINANVTHKITEIHVWTIENGVVYTNNVSCVVRKLISLCLYCLCILFTLEPPVYETHITFCQWVFNSFTPCCFSVWQRTSL